jgi:lysophospholipase L1-like esterase
MKYLSLLWGIADFRQFFPQWGDRLWPRCRVLLIYATLRAKGPEWEYSVSAKTLTLFIITSIISCGLSNGRDIHAEPQSDQNVMIVAAFGTSLTYRAGWLEPLEEKLTRCLAHPVRVLDFGRNGATSEWGIAAVGEVIRTQPDVVLIEFSANDAAWFKGVSLNRSRVNTTKIVRAIKEARPSAKIFLMTMNPAFGPRGWIRLSLDTYYDLYQSLADELSVGFIDNRQKWKALTIDELRTGIPDGGHPLPALARRILVPTVARSIGGARCD